jgi:hypothetical protein
MNNPKSERIFDLLEIEPDAGISETSKSGTIFE